MNRDVCEHFNPVDLPCAKCGAEPVQEPVAWQWLDTAHFRKKIPAGATPAHWRPLFTAPPQRKPLTEEEIDSIWDSEKAFADIYAIARAIERAHRIV